MISSAYPNAPKKVMKIRVKSLDTTKHFKSNLASAAPIVVNPTDLNYYDYE